MRSFTFALALASILLLTLTACAPDKGLRVEPVSEPTHNLLERAKESAGKANDPFSISDIRKAIEDSSGRAVTGSAPETESVIQDCRECLKFTTPFMSDKRKFQVVTLTNPKQRSEIFAGFVVSEKDGKPRLELVATGNQLVLSPGANGTLVVQEASYVDGDEPCCPSGWSVQIFRFYEGRFEPGQRFTRLNGET